MAALSINSKHQFELAIRGGVSIVDFSAHWCGPCRCQDPIIDALDKAFKRRITVVRMNIDENQLIAMDLGIQSLPTTLIFRQGVEVNRFIGLQSVETLDAALKAALRPAQQNKGGR